MMVINLLNSVTIKIRLTKHSDNLTRDVAALGTPLTTFRCNTVPSLSRDKRHSSQIFKPLKMKALGSFETSGMDYTFTRRHVPEESSSQPHRHDNRKNYIIRRTADRLTLGFHGAHFLPHYTLIHLHLFYFAIYTSLSLKHFPIVFT
jgi:hypothetical protein